METFDTNVVVRVLVEDDEAQGRRAEAAWRSALSRGGIFLSKIVVVETVWVLRSAYRFNAATTAAAIQQLLIIDGVTVEDEDDIRQALSLFQNGGADLADYLILETARQAQALPVRTFDQRFARTESVELVDQQA